MYVYISKLLLLLPPPHLLLFPPTHLFVHVENDICVRTVSQPLRPTRKREVEGGER